MQWGWGGVGVELGGVGWVGLGRVGMRRGIRLAGMQSCRAYLLLTNPVLQGGTGWGRVVVAALNVAGLV